MEEKEIARCPFCDGEAELLHNYVQCKQCNCRTRDCNSEEEALAAWNKRSLMFYFMPRMFGVLTAVYQAAKDQNSLFFDPEIFPIKVESIIKELLEEMDEARR